VQTTSIKLTSVEAALLRALYESGPARIGPKGDAPFDLEAAERLEQAGLLRVVRLQDPGNGGYFAISGKGISSLSPMAV
jgi:hypothetical protein